MPVVLPFPAVRRRAFLARQARRMTELNHVGAENLLRFLIEQQATTMARKGIAPVLIDRELRSLETGIRAEFWRLTLMEGGAA